LAPNALQYGDYEYPIERNIGLFSAFASAKASSHQGFQFTGLYASFNRYGNSDINVVFRL